MAFDTELKIQIPSLEINNYTPEEKVLPLIGEQMAKRLLVMPLFQVKTQLVVAMANPSDFIALNELKRNTHLSIFPVLVDENSLKNSIIHYYETVDTLQEELNVIAHEMRVGGFAAAEVIATPTVTVASEETPVIRLVDTIINQAIKIKASDIHMEPDQGIFRMRYRVDGILQELATFPMDLLPALISRIKIISGLDIAENRMPQDGRAKLNVAKREVDLRVSTFPTVFGENMVIRVLDKAILDIQLENLGISPEIEPHFNEVVQSAYGIILVAGPTGSGKTTTLYAILNKINTIKKNIVTIEDPVEYSLEMVRQSHINPKIGLTFATGLRSILRQDPDIILVGEIRDLETTEIAIQAALTGHLVFSTVHTNDAPSTMARLIDMGAEPFLLASAIDAVIAQRLVRQICPECKKAYKPDPALLKRIGMDPSEDIDFYMGEGCIHCRYTGYTGRIGIFELLLMSDEIKDLVVQKASSAQIKNAAVARGMITMLEDGLNKVRRGVTTIDEVLRVTSLMIE
ncbi:MAG: GspE/PulE family protein [Candidatus Margulisiibacteriota bacterium]